VKDSRSRDRYGTIVPEYDGSCELESALSYPRRDMAKALAPIPALARVALCLDHMRGPANLYYY